jgi:hypothetical protein
LVFGEAGFGFGLHFGRVFHALHDAELARPERVANRLTSELEEQEIEDGRVQRQGAERHRHALGAPQQAGLLALFLAQEAVNPVDVLEGRGVLGTVGAVLCPMLTVRVDVSARGRSLGVCGCIVPVLVSPSRSRHGEGQAQPKQRSEACKA